MRRGASLVLILVFASCGDSGPPNPPSVTITLGATDAAGAGFYPLAGDQVLVPGSQGGFHVWMKYRVAGMAPRKVYVRRTARRVSDDRLVLLNESALEVGVTGPDGYWELPDAIRAFMCPSPIGVQVSDQLLRFEIQLRDPETDEVLASGEAEATPRCPPAGDPQRVYCENICTG